MNKSHYIAYVQYPHFNFNDTDKLIANINKEIKCHGLLDSIKYTITNDKKSCIDKKTASPIIEFSSINDAHLKTFIEKTLKLKFLRRRIKGKSYKLEFISTDTTHKIYKAKFTKDITSTLNKSSIDSQTSILLKEIGVSKTVTIDSIKANSDTNNPKSLVIDFASTNLNDLNKVAKLIFNEKQERVREYAKFIRVDFKHISQDKKETHISEAKKSSITNLPTIKAEPIATTPKNNTTTLYKTGFDFKELNFNDKIGIKSYIREIFSELECNGKIKISSITKAEVQDEDSKTIPHIEFKTYDLELLKFFVKIYFKKDIFHVKESKECTFIKFDMVS